MRINWGTGIVIAIALFMSFILYFVFKIQSDSRFDSQLVLQDYYNHEQNLGTQQQKQQNANALNQRLEIIIENKEVKIIFPQEFEYTNIEGTISLYRPSDEKLDFEIPISLSSSNLLIPRKVLADGRWDIYVDWKYKNTEYFNKKHINL